MPSQMTRSERSNPQRGNPPWPPSMQTSAPASPPSPTPSTERRSARPRPLASVPLPASLSSPLLIRLPRRAGGDGSAAGMRSSRDAGSPKTSGGGSVAEAPNRTASGVLAARMALQLPLPPLQLSPASPTQPARRADALRSSLGSSSGAWQCPSPAGSSGGGGGVGRGSFGGSASGGGGGAADARSSEQAAVCVALHVRPMSAAERTQGCQQLVAAAPGQAGVSRRRLLEFMGMHVHAHTRAHSHTHTHTHTFARLSHNPHPHPAPSHPTPSHPTPSHPTP